MINNYPEQDICPRIDTCEKVGMVLDKDLAGDWQYASTIRSVCERCEEKS